MLWIIYFIGWFIFANITGVLIYVAEDGFIMDEEWFLLFVVAALLSALWPLLLTFAIILSPMLCMLIYKDLNDPDSGILDFINDFKETFNIK